MISMYEFVYLLTTQFQQTKLWYEIKMWKSGNSIEGLDFPVYFKGTEPSDYDQACSVLTMDGVTLQELATIFPDSDNNIDDTCDDISTNLIG